LCEFASARDEFCGRSRSALKDNGGSVIRDAEDTPYGRLAAVADPTGAGFNLSSLNQY
jgi:predicted enzyme related to lactoylglutathione lyase